MRNGDEDLGLPGFAGRYKPQDDISFKRSCNENKIECFSLDEVYALYLENIRAILYTPDAELKLDMPRFRQSIDIIFGEMGDKLATSAKLLLDEAFPVVDRARTAENIFVALCVPFCLASILFLTRMRNNSNNEIDSFRQILHMVPFEYLRMNKEAYRYVKHAKITSGKAKAVDNVDDKMAEEKTQFVGHLKLVVSDCDDKTNETKAQDDKGGDEGQDETKISDGINQPKSLTRRKSGTNLFVNFQEGVEPEPASKKPKTVLKSCEL